MFGCDGDGSFILSNCSSLSDLEAEANRGSARARLQLARQLADGDCTPKSKVDALMWLQLIKTQPFSMGEFAEDGAYLGETNKKLAEFQVQVAALERELRDDLTTEEVTEAENKAENWVTPEFGRLKKLAEAGDAEAQYELAHSHFGYVNRRPYEDRLPWLEMAAAQGHPKAAYALGQHYGQELPPSDRDHERAFELYLIAAEAGHYLGRISVMLDYRDGEGVEQNLFESYKWLVIHQSQNPDFPDDLEESWQVEVVDRLTKEERRTAEEAARVWAKAHPQAEY